MWFSLSRKMFREHFECMLAKSESVLAMGVSVLTQKVRTGIFTF